jgi:hypothetical protein
LESEKAVETRVGWPLLVVGGATPLSAGIFSGTFVSSEDTSESTTAFALGARFVTAVDHALLVDFREAPFAAFFVVFAWLFAALFPASVIGLDFDSRLEAPSRSSAMKLEGGGGGATGRPAVIGFSACRRRSSRKAAEST